MIRVQQEDFCLASEYAALSRSHQAGAVVTFVGRVREMNQGAAVSGMILEHYPGMTEHALAQIVNEAQARWPLPVRREIHRVGAL